MPGGGVVHVPAGWLAEWVDLPEHLDPRALADALVRAGLEVERVESAAEALSGPVVVGRVLSAEPEPQRNGKTINWCSVDVGPEHGTGEDGAGPRGIVCGAHNLGPGDLVVVSLPGAVLPGGFAIAARRTYGHVSDGMICSARELGLGDEHDGIVVLPADSAVPGADALDVLGLREAVLDIAVTPDRGYCLSVRGLAREAATAFGAPYRDVAASVVAPEDSGDGWPVTVDAPDGCDRFCARVVVGLDAAAPTPDWMARRLVAAGMRPISLAVDVTNYVMLETGQPLHAFDRDKLSGALGVRRARPGEKLTTLDDVVRALDVEDLVVTDDSGPVALAGVMGGASTEVDATTSAVVLEAAHWDPSAVARTVRRHGLPSEAAKRFERGVDPQLGPAALQRCVDLLAEYGGAHPSGGTTVVGAGPAPVTIRFPAARTGELVGRPVDEATVRRRLEQVGCEVAGEGVLTVLPPSWRPDLTQPADLVEEVVRLEGYDTVPSALPTPPPGRGLTPRQRLRRAVARAVAGAGLVEVISSPFVNPSVFDALGLGADDPRRAALRLANPRSDGEPTLRTTLLPGLLATALRNVGRGSRDLALVETGLVFLGRGTVAPAPRPTAAHRPDDDEIAALNASVPHQPRHLAAVLTGAVERPGWWGPGRTATWADAVEVARTVARAARTPLEVRRGNLAPWHPGRCAELLVDGRVVGHAGELHPRAVAALGLPERTCAVELDLDALVPPEPAVTPVISAYPPVLLDVALVVPADAPAAAVQEAVRAGAGELLESVRLFDVFTGGDLAAAGEKSLAFALRFRAPDRTLTVEEALAARDAAVAVAAAELGARLRG